MTRTITKSKAKSKIYYKVLGDMQGVLYVLGFTSSRSAWLKNPNGWRKDQLKFIPLRSKTNE